MENSDANKLYVLLTTDFKPMTGGVAEYLHNLWNEVAKKLQVMVLTTVDDNGEFWERAYHYEKLPSPPARRLGERFGDEVNFCRKVNTALYFFQVRQYAEKVVDLIQSHGQSDIEVFIGSWWGEISHFFCRALRRRQIPYSVHVYGLELVSPFYGRLPNWRREDLRLAQGLFACSSGSASLVKDQLGLDVLVEAVTPGIRDQERAGEVNDRKRELSQRFALEGGKTLLTVCRLVPRKGVDLALRSVAALSQEFPAIRYLVAGNGPDQKRLEQIAAELGIRDRVFFLGEVDGVVKAALYELCDVFVMPNRLLGGVDWEGFGIVFLEAAMAGKPSIGGNNGGVPDAIQQGVTGFLVNTDADERETTEALRQFLRDEEFLTQFGKAAKERAETHFSWDKVGERFLKMLSQTGA